MNKYALRRIAQAIPLLFAISVVLFIIMNTIGDPLLIQISERRPPTGEQLEVMRRRMGLDKPIFLQYLYWLIGNDWTLIDTDGDGDTDENINGPRKGIIRGDLGLSLTTRQPVQERIWERFPNTLLLMIPMYISTLFMAVSLGIIAALRQYSVWDNVLSTVAYIFRSMPIFFISLGAIFIFAVWFRKWGLPHTPIAGMYGPGAEHTLGNLIRSMILPGDDAGVDQHGELYAFCPDQCIGSDEPGLCADGSFQGSLRKACLLRACPKKRRAAAGDAARSQHPLHSERGHRHGEHLCLARNGKVVH